MGGTEMYLTSDERGMVRVQVTGMDSGNECSHERHTPFRCGAIIKGITSTGGVFRPSDWAQRMAAAATVSCAYCGGRGEGRFNPHVRVLHLDGVTCLWVADELLEIDVPLHVFIMRFAHDNGLRMIAKCR